MAIKYFLNKRIPPYKIYKNDNQKPTVNAMSAVQDHSNRIQGVMGLAGKHMAAVSAAQDNWQHAQGVMGLAGKHMAAVSAAQDNWQHAQGVMGLAGKHMAAVSAAQDNWQHAQGVMGLASKQMNAMRAIQEHWSISLKNILSDLDEKYKYRSKQYNFQTKAHEQQWYLDEELVDHLLENQVTVFDEDKVIEYITDHFDEYIYHIVNSPVYETQKIIINQSVNAYKNGHYEIAIFPLFGAFDNVISRWAKGMLTKSYQHQNVYIHQFRGKLINTVKKNIEVVENIESINLINGLTVMNAYIDLFDSKPKDLTKINRNAILHGSYNYETLNQNSYLKIVVLLKSALALLEIPLLESEVFN